MAQQSLKVWFYVTGKRNQVVKTSTSHESAGVVFKKAWSYNQVASTTWETYKYKESPKQNECQQHIMQILLYANCS